MIRTDGDFTSKEVQGEFSLEIPLSSDKVAQSAGLSGPWTSDDLRGKRGISYRINPVSWDTLYASINCINGSTDQLEAKTSEARLITGPDVPVILRFNAIMQSGGTAGVKVECGINGNYTVVAQMDVGSSNVSHPNKVVVSRGQSVDFRINSRGYPATPEDINVTISRAFKLEVINETDKNSLVTLLDCSVGFTDIFIPE